MADRNVRIRISAQDMASGVLAQVRSSLLGVMAGFASGQVAVDAFYKAVQGLRAGVDEFIRAEQGIVRLQNAFSNLGPGMAEATARATEFADAMQSAFGVDDDAVVAAQEKFVRALGLTGDELERATKAAVEFAAGSGKSIEESATAIIKGAMGSGRALKEYGIEVDAAASKTDNLNSIIEQVGAKFSGAASAARGTLAGAMDNLKNASLNLGASFVQAGADGAQLTQNLNAMADAITTINNLVKDAQVGEYIRAMLAVTTMGGSELAGFLLKNRQAEVDRDTADVMSRGAVTASGLLPGIVNPAKAYTGDIGLIITEEVIAEERRRADLLKQQNDRAKEALAAEVKAEQEMIARGKAMQQHAEAINAATRAEWNAQQMFPMGPGNARNLPYTGAGTGNQPGDTSWFNPGELPFDHAALEEIIELENEATTAMLEFQKAIQQTSAAMIAGFVTSGVMSIFDEGADGAKNMGEAVKQLVKQLIAAVIQMAIMRAIMASMSGGATLALNTGGFVHAAVGRGRSPAIPGMWGLQPDFADSYNGGIPSWVGLESGLGPWRRPEPRGKRTHVDYIPALLSPGEVVLSPPAAERFYAGSPAQSPGVQLGMTVVGTSELARLLSAEVSGFVRRRGGTMYAG